MKYSVLGKEIVVNTMDCVTGSLRIVNGAHLSSVGLKDRFYFQMPDKFALSEESINSFGQIMNPLPLTEELYVLSKFLGKNVWNRRIVDQYAEPHI